MTTNNEKPAASDLSVSAGSDIWEQRCRHMAKALHRIMVAQGILCPGDIMMPELLALAEDHADFLEKINSQNNKSAHAEHTTKG